MSICQANICKSLVRGLSFQIPPGRVCFNHAAYHALLYMRGKIFTGLLLSHSHVDALYQSEDDEHPGLLLPGHSEDVIRISEADPSPAA